MVGAFSNVKTSLALSILEDYLRGQFLDALVFLKILGFKCGRPYGLKPWADIPVSYFLTLNSVRDSCLHITSPLMHLEKL